MQVYVTCRTSQSQSEMDIEKLTLSFNITERSDENDAITALIAAFVVSLIVIVVLGIVVAFLWNKMKR